MHSSDLASPQSPGTVSHSKHTVHNIQQKLQFTSYLIAGHHAAQCGGSTCHTVHTTQLKHLVAQTYQPPDHALQTVASQVSTWVCVPS